MNALVAATVGVKHDIEVARQMLAAELSMPADERREDRITRRAGELWGLRTALYRIEQATSGAA